MATLIFTTVAYVRHKGLSSTLSHTAVHVATLSHAVTLSQANLIAALLHIPEIKALRICFKKNFRGKNFSTHMKLFISQFSPVQFDVTAVSVKNKKKNSKIQNFWH